VNSSKDDYGKQSKEPDYDEDEEQLEERMKRKEGTRNN